jgi:hypothetical protein
MVSYDYDYRASWGIGDLSLWTAYGMLREAASRQVRELS